ncbi:actin-related protein T2 [Numida meleagris]|uniref:actin-related protein T2 n=1 Tax=Numida meleagris TaxID=8996 RepID=UPI000B3E0AB8|nr:actin-related protein T2 [Numida meleagris]
MLRCCWCPAALPILRAMSRVAAAGAPVVVFDNGSGQCKAGLSGELAPRSVIPTIVGYPKFTFVMIGMEHRDWYVGEEAQSKRGILSLTYPMENGVVTSWDNMEKIWRYLYEHELRVKPSEGPVLLTETPLNPRSHREKMAELMFESFQVPALYLALQALAALHACARTTGMVLDSGDGVTVTVPIHGGSCLLQGVTRLDFAGRGVTKYLARLLLEMGHSFVSATEEEIVRDMKEKLCYIALDPIKKMQQKPENLLCEYVLPDGRTVKAGDQLFRAPEALFAPTEVEIQGAGVVGMILQSAAKCNARVRMDVLRNVVLAGGSTLFRGFKERLLKELRAEAPSTASIRIISPRNRMHSVWIGASLLANLTSLQNMWVTREDYSEVGPTVLERKYF